MDRENVIKLRSHYTQTTSSYYSYSFLLFFKLGFPRPSANSPSCNILKAKWPKGFHPKTHRPAFRTVRSPWSILVPLGLSAVPFAAMRTSSRTRVLLATHLDVPWEDGKRRGVGEVTPDVAAKLTVLHHTIFNLKKKKSDSVPQIFAHGGGGGYNRSIKMSTKHCCFVFVRASQAT